MSEFPIIAWAVICHLLPGLHCDFDTEAEAIAYADTLRGAIASEGGDAVVLVSAIVDAPPLHEILECEPHEVDRVLDTLDPWEV